MFAATEPERADINTFMGEIEGTDEVSDSEGSEDNESVCKKRVEIEATCSNQVT
jgi:hypothetical protein